ncbi:MAG: hypothetical protein IPH07_25415 [Deltaproteobacteria bacterium]|nr:hypothetical protein [Deltaproteobacteria bacterium]MBK8240629.1 hypothetical protein [Deltaproteobacteria bacterium]MBK8718096.1 hypothetical protein [Deltaproteobacteria bacterium]MBP7288494.1 hypothetical protein [Nannocystaceae bacterium]
MKHHDRSTTTRIPTWLYASIVMVACEPATVDDDGFGFQASGSTGVVATGGSSSGAGEAASATLSASSTISTSADESSTGVDECGVGAHCGDPAPASWFGPTVIAKVGDGVAMPDCPTDYPEAGPTMLEGYHDPGPAQCDCTCDLNVSQTCTSYTYSYSGAACNTYLNFQQFSQDCHDFAIGGSTYFYMYQAQQPFCMQNKVEEFPEATWDATIRSCKLPDDAVACGNGGACQPDAPEGFEAGLCIYKQGDALCPEGQYSEKFSYWAGVDDQRDCSSCTCGTATATCTGSMHVFDGMACGGNQVADVPSNYTCVPATGASVGLNFTGMSDCPIATAPEPTGTIAPSGNFTFCCQP